MGRLVKKQHDEYKEQNRTIKRRIREANEKWTQEQRDEGARLHQMHDSFTFHRKVKEITGASIRTALPSIRNQQGRPISDTDELKEVWRNYAEALFKDLRTNNPTHTTENMSGPKILESEVQYAISCKSPGHDMTYMQKF